MRYQRGDRVRALTADGGSLTVRVLEGNHMDGEFEIVVVCSEADWATVQAGGTPDDYWDEWYFAWPVEALEPDQPDE